MSLETIQPEQEGHGVRSLYARNGRNLKPVSLAPTPEA